MAHLATLIAVYSVPELTATRQFCAVRPPLTSLPPPPSPSHHYVSCLYNDEAQLPLPHSILHLSQIITIRWLLAHDDVIIDLGPALDAILWKVFDKYNEARSRSAYCLLCCNAHDPNVVFCDPQISTNIFHIIRHSL
jgi:hypothetical protein